MKLLLLFVLPMVAQSCTSDLDCSLGGTCVDSACSCDPTWTGSRCSVLNLLASPDNGCAYCDVNHSSWGGSPAYDNATSTYIMATAVMLNRCGLNSWQCNSAIALASSRTPNGPYKFQGEAQVLWQLMARGPCLIAAHSMT